ncbi:hypothetical protein OIU76_028343 [Salix suchowensis]|nr:hypothetical protein OIU76_028343 [Salix suchowensis]
MKHFSCAVFYILLGHACLPGLRIINGFSKLWCGACVLLSIETTDSVLYGEYSHDDTIRLTSSSPSSLRVPRISCTRAFAFENPILMATQKQFKSVRNIVVSVCIH